MLQCRPTASIPLRIISAHRSGVRSSARRIHGQCSRVRPATASEPEELAALELVRLTFPRRTYTQSHMDYLVEVVTNVWHERANLPGYRIVEERPVLRAFTAKMAPIS